MKIVEDGQGKAPQIILWVLAIMVVFALAAILGWKVFYGYVVPQTNNLSAFSTMGLFAFAALAGLMVNFGPCSLAVLPAYMSFYLGISADDNEKAPIRTSLKLGAIASLGVIGFYLVLGTLFAGAGTFLAAYTVHLKLVITFIILFLGIVLLKGGSIDAGFISSFRNFVNKGSRDKSQVVSLLGFGVVYGAGGLSCFLPVFLPLVFFPFVSGRFVESIASFIVFSGAQAIFLIGATVLVGLGKQTLFREIIGKAEMMKKVAGVILILTSAVMFGLFIFIGM